jgi:hypothetical protein
MTEHALSKKLGLDKVKIDSKFERIVIDDSTVFQLPAEYSGTYRGSGGGGSDAGIKTQYCYDLLSQEIIDITIQSGTVPDCKYPLQDLRVNDLRIEDLGYFRIDRLLTIAKKGAYFLSRLKFGVNLYVLKKGKYQRLNLVNVIDKMKEGEIKPIWVYLGRTELFSTRLILQKVPKNIADEKRRKLKTDKQNKRRLVSKERLVLCDVNAFVTNCTPEQLPDHLLRQCYSLRWQIEIIFKAWKSFFKIDKVTKMKVQRFECFNYGCLMWIVASTHLLAYFKHCYLKRNTKEISELKFFKLMVSIKQKIKEVIEVKPYQISGFLDQLAVLIERTCIKEQKKDKLSPLKIIAKIP